MEDTIGFTVLLYHDFFPVYSKTYAGAPLATAAVSLYNNKNTETKEQTHMPDTHPKLQFTSDYMEGAHPSILEALVQTNLQKTEG